MVGCMVGRFEVQRELASSAIRSIYKARDPKSGKTLALLTVKADTAAGQDFERRLRLQAKAANILNSPNIAVVHGGGVAAGMFFVALEYVDGNSLRTLLSRGERFSVSAIVDLARQVCTGLDHAHHHGIFHTNLHPGNILVEMDGTAKIMDFGIPKDLDLTTADERLGYLAPQQINGEPPDARSNLFSWATIVYELLTGKQAFVGPDTAAVCLAVKEANPAAPHEVNAAVPTAISSALMKALAKDPGERFQSGKELVAALENYREPARPPAPVGPISLPKRMPVAASAYATMPPNPPPPVPVLRPAEPMGAAPISAPATMAPFTPPPEPLPEGAEGTVYTPPEEQPAAPPKPPLVDVARAKAEVKRRVYSAADTLSRPETEAKLKRSLRYAVPVMAVLTVVLLGLAGYYYVSGRTESTANVAPSTSVTTPAPRPKPAVAAQPSPSASVAERPVVTIAIGSPVTARPSRKKSLPVPVAPAPAVVTTGELAINSTPDGALIQIDGNSNPAWRTPLVATLNPGAHNITLIKPGYGNQSQTVQVDAGKRNSYAASLNELGGTVSVVSEPAGATVLIDGKERGITPAQLVVTAGAHAVAVRKNGYFDFGTQTQVAAGQSTTVNASLKVMGNVNDVRTTGKFGKLLGRNSKDMGAIQIRTQPRGAKVTINDRIMDKNTPTEFLLPPGHYEIVLSYPGYQPLRKMVSVEPAGKLVLEETLLER